MNAVRPQFLFAAGPVGFRLCEPDDRLLPITKVSVKFYALLGRTNSLDGFRELPWGRWGGQQRAKY